MNEKTDLHVFIVDINKFRKEI